MDQIEMYSKSNFCSNEINAEIVQRYFEILNWKKNETILDIGMGDGKFTVNGLLPNVPRDIQMLVGCDYVPWKVEFAKKTHPHPKVKYVELDIQTKELSNQFHEKFDHVFSFIVLHWVKDLRQAMENVYVMLKPGGEFFFTVLEKGVDEAFHLLSKNPKWASYGNEQFVSRFMHVQDRLPIWRNLLQDTGFLDLNCFREYFVYQHKSRDICEELYKSINPIITDIPQEEQDEYIEDYFEGLIKSKLMCYEICPETQKELCFTKGEILILHGKKPDTK